MLTVLFSRTNFKTNVEDTLGLFAPDPNQGPEDPGPAIGDITLSG